MFDIIFITKDNQQKYLGEVSSKEDAVDLLNKEFSCQVNVCQKQKKDLITEPDGYYFCNNIYLYQKTTTVVPGYIYNSQEVKVTKIGKVVPVMKNLNTGGSIAEDPLCILDKYLQRDNLKTYDEFVDLWCKIIPFYNEQISKMHLQTQISYFSKILNFLNNNSSLWLDTKAFHSTYLQALANFEKAMDENPRCQKDYDLNIYRITAKKLKHSS